MPKYFVIEATEPFSNRLGFVQRPNAEFPFVKAYQDGNGFLSFALTPAPFGYTEAQIKALWKEVPSGNRNGWIAREITIGEPLPSIG